MISVCIPTYNGEKYIATQLISILQQIDQDDEIIISDDNSTDSTVAIIKGFNDKRIKLLHGNYSSPILNLENALKHAKGDIIFLSDQDDVWMENKVFVSTQALQQADCVISDCIVTDNKLTPTFPSFFDINMKPCSKWRALIKNPYLGCCMAFNRNVLEKAIPFPKNIPMHDIFIGNLSAFFFKVKFIRQPLILYRRHNTNTSTASGPSKNSICKQLSLRYNLIKALLKKRGQIKQL